MKNSVQNTKTSPEDIIADYELEQTNLPATETVMQLPNAQKPKPFTRLRQFLQNMPKFTDPSQKRAGANILRFLALVLVLTFIARGTAGATLANVTLSGISKNEIVEYFETTAKVQPINTQPLTVPEGLRIEETLASEGQKIATGDTLARFNIEDIENALLREINALKTLELKLQQLLRGKTYDDSALSSAQKRANCARENYSSVEKNVSPALDAYNNAQAAATAAQQEYDRLSADPETDPAALAIAQDTANTLHTSANDALANYNTIKDDFESKQPSLNHEIEDADAALALAQTTDKESRQQAADSSAQNKLDAEGTRLDIKKQTEKVEALQTLNDAKGLFLAELDGTVLSYNAPVGKTSENELFNIGTGTGGYVASALMPKKEAEKLESGSECNISTDGGSMYYNPTVTGKVLSVSAPDENNMCTVKFSLPNNENWKANQNVNISATLSRNSYDTCVPLGALHSSNGGYYLLSVEETSGVLGTQNIVVKIPVTLTAKDAQNAAVSGGILYDSKIIKSSSKPLSEGDKVRLS